MLDDGSRYRMCGEVYSYDELKAASEAELAELNELQGSNFSFDQYLSESLLTGTIETVDDDDEDPDDDWRRGTKYLYAGRVVTYDELRAEVEAEAAGLPPEQWLDGEFVFEPWLSDSLVSGHVKRVDQEPC